MKTSRRCALVIAFVVVGSEGCAITNGADADEDKTESSTASIIGGNATSDHPAVGAILWMARKQFCTAFLIAPRLIMTAGHCMKNAPLPDGFFVGTGSTVTNPTTIPNGFTKIAVNDSEIHPSYRGPGVQNETTGTLDQSLNDFRYDIAILRLSTEVKNIKPLPVGAHAGNPGNRCTIVGFGFESTANNAGFLRKRSGIATILRFMGDHTEVGNGADPARGDSGSPLLCDEGVVRGVSSFYFRPDTTRVDDRDFYVQTHNKRPWVNTVANRWGVTGIAQ